MTVGCAGRWLSVLLVLVVVSGCAGLPQAESPDWRDQVIERISTEELLELMTLQGYEVSLDEDGDILWHQEGRPTYIMVLSSQQTLLFMALYHNERTSMADINQWNASRLFSRAYLDGDDDPILELDLSLRGGITMGHLVDFLTLCQIAFDEWYHEVL